MQQSRFGANKEREQVITIIERLEVRTENSCFWPFICFIEIIRKIVSKD